MAAAFWIALALYIIGLAIRDGYELLKRSRSVDPKDTRVFAVVFTSMVVMWVSWFAFGALAPMRLTVPAAVGWFGLGVVGLGTGVSVAGMWQLGGVENIDHLVKTGLFSKIRHPMYAGFFLWIVGWCAYTGAPASILLAPFGMASVLWWRQLEESELAVRYGAEYADYQAATWF
jgi:protein-S-isoprenylcysteine O-methyltransferase Ste14